MKFVLRETRIARGLSQEQLSRKIEMGVQVVAKLEKGQVSHLSVDTLQKLCNALGCGLEGILQIEPEGE